MEKLRNLFGGVAFLPLLMIVALTARAQTPPPIAVTFNEASLRAEMALSCRAQEDLRRKNLLPPYFPGTPAAFENKEGALAVYSPYLNAGQRQRAEQLLEAIPEHVRAYGFRAGAVYVFPRRGIVEAVPALAQDKDYYSDTGLYMAVQRSLFVPFEKGEVVIDRHGGVMVQRWMKSTREPFRIINHESGHMIDDLIGDLSEDSLGADGDHRLSNRRDFQEAMTKDLRHLTGPHNKLSQREIRRLGYYLPDRFEGRFLGGMRADAQRARREVFAELWAEVQGYDSNRLSMAYPESFKVVKAIDEYLLALHNARPVQCIYGADGRARPAPPAP